MGRFENWSDVRTLWSFGHSLSCGIKNKLEATAVETGKIKKQRVAVVEF